MADWIFLWISILDGCCVFGRILYLCLSENIYLVFYAFQLGAYMMIVGWGLSLFFLYRAYGAKPAVEEHYVQTDEEHTE